MHADLRHELAGVRDGADVLQGLPVALAVDADAGLDRHAALHLCQLDRLEEPAVDAAPLGLPFLQPLEGGGLVDPGEQARLAEGRDGGDLLADLILKFGGQLELRHRSPASTLAQGRTGEKMAGTS